MKVLIFYLLLSFSMPGYSHFKKADEAYLVSYKKGPKWNRSLPFKKQRGIGSHIIHLKKLYHKGHIKFGVNNLNKGFGRYVFEGRKKRILRLLNEDPGVNSGLITYRLEPVAVSMIRKAHVH